MYKERRPLLTTSSLVKSIVALLSLSLYIWLFGIVGIVEGSEVISPETAPITNPDLPVSEEVNTEAITRGAGSETLYPPPITKYETSINASNYPKPGFADYPAQTTAPYYFGAVSESVSDSETTKITSETEPTTTQTEATTPEPTTTTTTTTAATTTTPAPTTTTTNDELLEDEDDDNETAASTTQSIANNSELGGQKITVSNSGVNVTDTATNIVARVVQNEIGSSFELEAIKAQAVAAYTYIKMYNDNGAAANVVLASVASERVMNCVKEVIGQAVYYDGKIIQATYYASSAGYTASSVNVWGVDYPYLRCRECPLDERYDVNYGIQKNFTSNELLALIVGKTGINPDGDPSTWIKILNHTDEVFVGDITIGGKKAYTINGVETKLTGRTLREKVIGTKDLRSTAFKLSYDATKDMFTFTTYGYGHGVGLSQHGANILAKYEGYNYKQILQYYYQGTEVY